MVITKNPAPRIALETGDLPMTLTTSFERMAVALVERLSELLFTDIWVLDEQHAVIASSRRRDIGHPGDLRERYDRHHTPQISFCLGGRAGKVLIGAPFHEEVISPRLAHALVRLVISQTYALERSPQQLAQKNAFIYHLLQGVEADEDAILREAGLLGLDLATPRAVILIHAGEYILAADARQERGSDEAREQRRAQLVISSIVGFFHLPNDTICAYIGQGEIAILKASNTKNLLPWAESGLSLDGAHATWANLAALKRAGEALLEHLQSDISREISIGIGRYHPGVGGIARSYQDARAALAVGRRYGGDYCVHCLDHLGIAAFVGILDKQIKLDLAAHLLSPLDHEPELLETLQVFFAQNCCSSETAQQLMIHRNTLAYRLQKVMLLTGLDPRRFEDATQIHLALLLRSFDTSAG